MELANSPVIKTVGDINIDYWGIRKTSNFFAELTTYPTTTLQGDLYRLNWMDANMFAFFNVYIHRHTNGSELVIQASEENATDELSRYPFNVEVNWKSPDFEKVNDYSYGHPRFGFALIKKCGPRIFAFGTGY